MTKTSQLVSGRVRIQTSGSRACTVSATECQLYANGGGAGVSTTNAKELEPIISHSRVTRRCLTRSRVWISR